MNDICPVCTSELIASGNKNYPMEMELACENCDFRDTWCYGTTVYTFGKHTFGYSYENTKEECEQVRTSMLAAAAKHGETLSA